MPKYETTHRAIVREASEALVVNCGVCSVQTFRQNVWTVIENIINVNEARRVYYGELQPVGLTRLYTKIAREAYRMTHQKIDKRYPFVMRLG